MKVLVPALALVLAGCASFDGRGLVPGASTEQEVAAAMGAPALALQRPDGGKLLYFSRQPYGRAIFRADIGANGVLRGLDQTLKAETIRGLQADKATKEQVREQLGPPYRVAYGPIKPLEVWEYWWRIVEDRRILWVSFSDDGVLREVLEMHDYQSDTPSGPKSGGKSM